jgi:hypothetical protein
MGTADGEGEGEGEGEGATSRPHIEWPECDAATVPCTNVCA